MSQFSSAAVSASNSYINKAETALRTVRTFIKLE